MCDSIIAVPPYSNICYDIINGSIYYLEQLQFDPKILVVAEEIVSGSDTVGISESRLELLVRAVLYLDRSARGR